ncbi:egl nine homolog 1-like [Ostrea edulis]|uniref:egl nine homolog 1-like n=1 Tax=Ostrea edulis TaxID=37623 RepID=UPI002094A7DC|nr:egl nine homolog 1-like [Ostrea edulis]
MDKDANSDHACVVCGSKENLKRCTRCKGAVYCCRQHQIQDWPSHKTTCSPNQNGAVGDQANTCTLDENNDSKIKNTTNANESDVVEFDGRPNTTNANERDVVEFDGRPNTTNANERDVVEFDGRPNTTNANERDVVEFDGRPFKETNFKKPTSFEVSNLAEFVIQYINKNNFCVVDGIFSDTHLQRALSEINSLNSDGCLKLGRLSGGRTSGQEALKVTKTEIRSDTIYWAEGTESRHPNINKVVQKMDAIICSLNNHFQGKYFINGRTKAMIACYPGNGSYYRRHIDNPSGDGRVITCILYLNKDWISKEHGGVLRIFSAQDESCYVDVSPIYNRMLFFWSDRRNPHEVQPAFRTRFAITVWFFDKAEREKAKEECALQDVSSMKNELMILDLQRMGNEKTHIEQKIQQEAKRVIESLTTEELQALAELMRGHKDPNFVMSQMGISPSIQSHLLKELEKF